MTSVGLRLVPDAGQVLGEFTTEFEFTVRLADLGDDTLALYTGGLPVFSINAASSRADQVRVFGEFLDRCAAHQRKRVRPALGLVEPEVISPPAPLA